MVAGGASEDEVERLIRELEQIDSEFRAVSRTYAREYADRIKERLRADRRVVQQALEELQRTGSCTSQVRSSPRIWIQEVRNTAAIVFAAEQTLKARLRGNEAVVARAARDRALGRLEELLCSHPAAGTNLVKLLEHY